MSQVETGRVRQKQRTRAALLKAARELLAGEGDGEPTIQAVADHAGISRATAYRYYSSTELLLQEAALDGIAERIGTLQIAAGESRTIEGRVDKVVADVIDMVLDNEAMFRTYLRTAVAGETAGTGASRVRGGRRLGWIRDAFADDPRLTRPLAEKLTFALALLTGVETVVVARDVCGLDPDATREAARWTARTLLKGALSDGAER